MLRDFLTDYKDGLVSSLQGFLVLHKLNQPSPSQTPLAPSPQKEKSKMTVLERRRAEVRASNSETSTSNGIRRKPSALKRVFQVRKRIKASSILVCGSQYNCHIVLETTGMVNGMVCVDEIPRILHALQLLSIHYGPLDDYHHSVVEYFVVRGRRQCSFGVQGYWRVSRRCQHFHCRFW